MGYRIVSTVTTPAASRNLVSLSTVKADLGITVSTYDTQLASLIARASAAIEQACNRVFTRETLRDEVWPDREAFPYQVPGGIAPLQLSRFPIVSVASVTENGDALTVDTDYVVNAAMGTMLRLGADAWPKSWPTWKLIVTYEAGFATIPADIEDAASRLVKRRYYASRRDETLKREVVPGVLEREWWIASGGDAGNLTPDIADILDNYRVPVVV